MTRPSDMFARPRRAPRSRRPRLVVQELEDRATPAQLLVTSAADSGSGTLREAIDLANASAAADEIVFDTANLFATPQTITLASALPQVAAGGGPLTITGPGRDRLTVDGNDAVRVLSSAAPELTLSGFTIANAFGAGKAAALRARGVTRLDGMVIRDSHATGPGGGVYMELNSFLHVRNCTISGNSAGSKGGGGIYMYFHGGLVVENSTVSGNTAAATGSYGGAGIHFWGNVSATPPAGFEPSALVIRNSTIANNSVTGSGGGINLAGFSDTLRVENSTISGNTATATGGFLYGGGGIRVTNIAGTIELSNSVVAGNTNADGPDIRGGGTVNADHSAIQSSTGFTLNGNTNNVLGQDPQLGPLQDNGGSTFTRAPLPGSPLIDAGPTTMPGVLFDQRGTGFARVSGPAADIGAVEVQPDGNPFADPSLPPVTTAGATTHTFTVTYHDEAGTPAAGIDVSTLISNSAAVRVAGPNGFDVPATYVSIDTATNGSPRTVTYAFTPPGGAWDSNDSGTYAVRVQAGAVKDVDGNPVPAGTIGTLLVSIPRTLVVTSAADAGPGSLREAITLANETPAPDEIVFATEGVFATPQTISLATALPVLSAAGGPLAIRGPGKDRLTVDGNNAVRGLSSLAPELILTGFTIARGATDEEGAGLRTTGITTLDGMVIRDSHADGIGGGVWRAADAFLAVRNSTISGNSSPFNGGGIVTYDAGGLIVENSTVSGNTVINGGQFNGYYGGAGIWFNGTPSANAPSGFQPGVVLIRNSTIANNFTDGSAGGIALVDFGGATLRVENSTISGNEAEKTGTSMFGLPYGGGGIRGFAGEVIAVITNSVVSGNVNADGPDLFFELATVEATNSAFGDPSGWASEEGNNLIGADLLLGPLQDNGGPTFTMAPLPGSPLVDAGDTALLPAGLTRDQRGLRRVDGPAVDIGAVETQRPPVTINRAAGQADPTNGTAVAFEVAFGTPVTGFDVADVDLSASTAGGTLVAAVSQTSSTTYRVTVTGITGSGDVIAAIPAGAATDPTTGLLSLASTSTDNEVTVDLDAPTVTINQAAGQPDPTNAGPIVFDVVFSEPVLGFAPTDLSFAGSTVGGILTPSVVQTGPATYTVSVSGMTGFGTVVASVPGATVTDPAGNANAASTGTDNEVLFNESAPTVTVNQAPDQDDPTSQPTIAFTVEFSESVTGFDATDVDLSASAAGGTLAAAVTQTGPTSYTVTVTGMTSGGTVVASIPADAVTDLAGFGNTASTSTDNVVEFLNAGVLSISTASQTVAEGTVIAFTVSRTGGSEGDVSVSYATVAGTAHEGSDLTLVTGTLSWAEGETDDKTFTVTIPDDTANEGKELFAVELTDAIGGVQIGTPTFGMAVAPSDGQVIQGSAKVPQAVFGEAVGPTGDNVTVRLAGKVGTATVYITDPDGDGRGPIEWIDLAGTDAAKSSLTITPKKPKGGTGNGLSTLDEVSGTGLKSLTAAKTDLIGTGLHLTGYLGSLKIGNVGGGADIVVGGAPPATLRNPSVKVTAGVIGDGSDVTVTAAPLGSLTAISVGNGTITAPSVGTISAKGKAKTKTTAAVPGDFNADVSVSGALKKLKVVGGITDAVITVAGNLGSVSVTGRVSGTTIEVVGNVGSVSVGSFWNSRLDAGYTGANNGGGTFDAASAVGPFRVTAKTAGFQNSYVIATTIKPVTLASITETNGGTTFGFIAGETLTGLTVTAPTQKFKFDPTQPSPQGLPGWDFQAIDLDGPAGP
jgi:parallel beta-helix repeat protein